MSRVRHSFCGGYADGCVRSVLRMHGMSRFASSKGGGLLRLLFVRNSEVSSDTAWEFLWM